MRKLLLNPTPLFRKLRQLSMLLTLLLALPQTAWGQTTYDKGTYNSQDNTWGDWEVTASNTTLSSPGNNFLSFTVASKTTATITLTLTNPGKTSEKICYALFSYNQDSKIPDDNKVKLLSAKIVDTNNSENDLTGDFNKEIKSCNFYAKTPIEWSTGDKFVVTLQVNNTTDNETQHGIQAAKLTTGTPYGLVVNGITVTNVNQGCVTNIVDEVIFTPGEGSNPATLKLNQAELDVTSANIAAIESSLRSLKVILAGENEMKCGNNKAFNLADNSELNFAADGTSPGQLTITSTSQITTESFYSPSTATVTYTDLMATNPTSTSVLISPPTSYGITVAGTRVTAQNANNILNDGKVTYTHNNDGTGTLTLNEATLNGLIRVSRPEALTIELIGANAITPSDNSAIKADFGTTQTPPTPDLIFKGEGYVTLTPGSSYPAISGFNVDLTTNGMYAEGDLTQNGAIRITKKYDITVENKIVTYVNKEDILSNVSFTPASTGNNNTNTLTLNGASINGKIESGLDALTIEFIGENQLTGASGYITSTNNSAPLTLKGGTGTSTLSIGGPNNNTNGNSGVEGFASVTLDGAYLKASNCCRYISADKAYKYADGIAVQDLTFTTTPHYPLWVRSVQVNESNKDNILTDNTPTALFNPATNILNLDGAQIDSSNGIESGLASLVIYLKGENSINTNTAAHYSPIYSNVETATLTIQKASNATDCELHLSSLSNNPQVIKGFASVSHTGLNFASKTGSSLDNSATKDAILTSATIYPLWVGGTLVTGTTTSGTDASSGSKVWEYDATNNKLTLTNYNKTDNDGHAFISNMANLNVYLVGTNSVGPNTNSQTSTGKAFYTTYTDATLTFSTDENNKGTLSASGYNTFCEGFRTVNGIYCNNGLGYFPGSREIKAKATPTIKFAKRDQTSGAELSPAEYVGASETLQTAVNSAFKAPRPEYDNDYQLFVDSTRYTYSYAPEGIVEIPVTATDPSTGNNTFGEMNILKAGTVTITCTYPGNLQNEACSASYTLQVNKADANLAYNATTSNAYIDLSGNGQWGDPNGTGGTAPTLTKPTNVTGITYTSSNTNVATVSTAGVVTPKGAGSATITATIKDDERYNDATASYTLTVMVPATISFANATASIVNTETYTQTASTVPAGSTITYLSSNNDVNVNANGEVTISNSFYGKATITATATAVPDADPQYYYVLPDNTAFQATYDLTVSKVFNSVKFEDGQNFATYYNDESENMTVPEGLTAYLITGTSGNSVVTYPINYLPQNVPLLLEKSGTAGSTLTNTIYSGTELTDAERGSNNLQYAEGNLGISDILGGTPYILYKNEFVKASGTIPQNHCYLLITNPAPTRGYYSIGNGNDDSTAIDDTLIDNEETTNDDWYDLQGRRIQKPTKAGIYIVNGKKMIVK